MNYLTTTAASGGTWERGCGPQNTLPQPHPTSNPPDPLPQPRLLQVSKG